MMDWILALPYLINKKIKIFCGYKDYMLPLHSIKNAAIAQLVEHNLAKVGVASSSLVCRSF